MTGRLIEFEAEDGVGQTTLNEFADTCPICGKAVEAIFIRAGAPLKHSDTVQVVFQCPRNACKSFFIAYYRRVSPSKFHILRAVLPLRPERHNFSDEIKNLSPEFVNIYNQAFWAEQNQLDQICGPGYRKALEFLTKDYACSIHPDEKEEIEKAFLGPCIKDYIDDSRIRNCAERAAWLGNDETHYVRKWSDKDIEDLKILIRLTVNWIESVVLTKRYVSDMPKS